MLEYCNNKLTVISDDDAEHAQFWTDAKGDHTELSFDSLLPMPNGLDFWQGQSWIEKNWGTVMFGKWNFSFEQRNLYISECRFLTEWVSPSPLISNICNRYPQTTFVLEAADIGETSTYIDLISVNDHRHAHKDDDKCRYNTIRKHFKSLMANYFEYIEV